MAEFAPTLSDRFAEKRRTEMDGAQTINVRKMSYTDFQNVVRIINDRCSGTVAVNGPGATPGEARMRQASCGNVG
jgi:hypothetical protein